MRKLPPLSAIRVFEAAARHEHFTAAADELGMARYLRILPSTLWITDKARAQSGTRSRQMWLITHLL